MPPQIVPLTHHTLKPHWEPCHNTWDANRNGSSLSAAEGDFIRKLYIGVVGGEGEGSVTGERRQKEVPDPKGQSQSGQRQGAQETEFQPHLTTPLEHWPCTFSVSSQIKSVQIPGSEFIRPTWGRCSPLSCCSIIKLRCSLTPLSCCNYKMDVEITCKHRHPSCFPLKITSAEIFRVVYFTNFTIKMK